MFPLKRDRESIYASPFRAQALRLAEAHCAGRYRVVREGETRGREYMRGRGGEEAVTRQRFWGFQFMCREAPAVEEHAGSTQQERGER